MNKGFAVAIDGPVASGKGTLASELTQKLGAEYLDTGAMYRCVALFCLKNEIDILDKKIVGQIARDIEIEFINKKTYLNKLNVSDDIRLPEVGSMVSVVAGNKKVRQELISKQQMIAKSAINRKKIFVAEGRDIGTVVIPDAQVKIYLTAERDMRAKRRRQQLLNKGIKQPMETVIQEIIDRDHNDIKINKSLVENPEENGYLVIDNTKMTIQDNLDLVLDHLKEKGLL